MSDERLWVQPAWSTMSNQLEALAHLFVGCERLTHRRKVCGPCPRFFVACEIATGPKHAPWIQSALPSKWALKAHHVPPLHLRQLHHHLHHLHRSTWKQLEPQKWWQMRWWVCVCVCVCVCQSFTSNYILWSCWPLVWIARWYTTNQLPCRPLSKIQMHWLQTYKML